MTTPNTIEELQAEVQRLQGIVETYSNLSVKQDAAINALTQNQGVRRRTNRSMSVKGVKTYEQTLETVGWTRDQHFAELTAMDAELNKVQPEITS